MRLFIVCNDRNPIVLWGDSRFLVLRSSIWLFDYNFGWIFVHVRVNGSSCGC